MGESMTGPHILSSKYTREMYKFYIYSDCVVVLRINHNFVTTHRQELDVEQARTLWKKMVKKGFEVKDRKND